jgi:hypothetical protein
MIQLQTQAPIRYHHLTLAVFVLPPDLRWTAEVFDNLAKSLGNHVKTFDADRAIVFHTSEAQRQFCKLRLGEDYHEPQVRFSIHRFHTSVRLKMEAKYGASEEQVVLVLDACKRLGYKVLKVEGVVNKGIICA